MPFDEESPTRRGIAEQGIAAYTKLQDRLESEHSGRIAAIDVQSEEYEVRDTALDASRALKQRIPDARIWLVRIGSRALRRIGHASASNGRAP